MNPWTRKEIHTVQVASNCHIVILCSPLGIKSAPWGLPNSDFKLINEVFNNFGPIPCLTFDKLSYPTTLKSYQCDLEIQLSSLSVSQLQSCIVGSVWLGMDMLSNKICLIHWVSMDVVSDNVHVLPVTDHITSLLSLQLCNFDQSEQLKLYHYFSAIPTARKMSGVLFEAFGQWLFQKKISIKIVLCRKACIAYRQCVAWG